MNFRGSGSVNGLRPPQAARETRAIDGARTSEKRGFHQVDGAPRRTDAARDAMRLLSLEADKFLRMSKAALSLFHRLGRGEGRDGRRSFWTRPAVKYIPRKPLKSQRSPSSKALTNLDAA